MGKAEKRFSRWVLTQDGTNHAKADTIENKIIDFLTVQEMNETRLNKTRL